jgi:tRNA pseudouridine55 synthase
MPDECRASGWLVVDKPKGLSSHRVVDNIRRVIGTKAGHAGTLDPLASGVLPVAIGEATKTIAYAMDGRKRYRFRIQWGVARTTDDSEGEIVSESEARPNRAEIEAILPRFTGRVMQTPPAYSALKIAGRRAYALARAGRPPSLPPRQIEIFDLQLAGIAEPDYADFEAEVGKGTYIRALARDLAAGLGTFGHITALRRLSVGSFTEADAIRLESISNPQHMSHVFGSLLPIETSLAGVPVVTLARTEAQRLRYGQRVAIDQAVEQVSSDGLGPGMVVSVWHDHALVALAVVEDGRLRPIRVING